MRVLLVFPPKGDIFQPPLGVASLTGYLKEKGYAVKQKDLNIEAISQLLSPHELSKAIEQIKVNFGQNKEKLKRELREQVDLCLKIGPIIVENIETAMIALKQLPRKERKSISTALDIINYAFLIISTRYYPSFISFYDYGEHIPEAYASSRKIEQSLREENKNMFFGALKKFVKTELPKIKPQIIGISVTYSQQLVAALNLSKLVKEANKDIVVILGGSYITQLKDKIPKIPFMFKFVDGYVIFDGEISFEKLLQQIKKKGSFGVVPNFIYRKKGKIIKNVSFQKPIFPLPSYAGFPLKKYFGPCLVLPLLTSKGCYWAKCAYCAQHRLFKKYSPLDVGQVISQIKFLSKKYATRYFLFNDLVIHPFFLHEISRTLLKEKVKIYWACLVRFEEEIDVELLETMHKAGCRLLGFGLESGSQRVLNKMSKGTNVKQAEKILQICKNIGIRTLLFAFFGFPTETHGDAIKTVKFVERNKKYIDILGLECSVFNLREGSKVFRNPLDYCIKIKNAGRANNLCTIYPYAVWKGLSQTEAKNISSDFKTPSNCEKYFSPFMEYFISERP